MMQHGISTREFARMNNVQPETVRKRFGEHGSYYGVIPEKRINGRLTWPAKSIHKVNRGGYEL